VVIETVGNLLPFCDCCVCVSDDKTIKTFNRGGLLQIECFTPVYPHSDIIQNRIAKRL
jgi:hypothetical protein